ncbi:hypothetical protein D1822_08510 [Phaeobacter inhibens]|uniref:hypothetical protein n=1 Tax=Phaeobacter inhibens TaxID=221822 RepID=UPI0001632C5E|nr:hypothetical protein [Phaeobacter inhibens]AFO91412.1 hypothetical protein PGA1_c17110 [Phaeobacter inhibens DSM 17395]AUQ46074.1 hypothetical protein PhaeoP10_01736 [Phaeobacter inhibens]AXT22865.1 hypothetical protein D1822_08510 [Phaeobacter inhibens]
MLRMTSIAALIAMTGAASAEVLTENATPNDAGETFLEENIEFMGAPVVDVNGVFLGKVVEVGTEPGPDRKILVEFRDSFSDKLSGLRFNLDGMWETDGVLRMGQTTGELRTMLENYASENPDKLTDGSVLN